MEQLNTYAGLEEQSEVNFEELLSEEMKTLSNEIKEDLLTIDPSLKDIKLLDELSKELVDKFLDKHHITVEKDFYEQLTTLFALTKYLSLVKQQNATVLMVEEELSKLLDKDKITWFIYKNFSNTIVFTKVIKLNSDEKPQSLTVKYRLDSETEKVIYSILSSNWTWDISTENLKALLENTTFSTTPINNNDLTYTIHSNNINISAGNLEIIVRKK